MLFSLTTILYLMHKTNEELYTNLVKNRDDLAGHVAFSLLHPDFFKWISDETEKNGKCPTEEQIISYLSILNSESTREGFNTQADNLVKKAVRKEVSEMTNKLREDMIQNFDKVIVEFIKKDCLEMVKKESRTIIEEQHTWKAIRWQIGINVLSSVIVMVGLLVFYHFSIATKGGDGNPEGKNVKTSSIQESSNTESKESTIDYRTAFKNINSKK